MRRPLAILAVALSGSLVTPATAHAVVGKLAKLAKLAGKAGKAGKLAGAAKLAGIGGLAFATERAGKLFRLIPDDAARAASYVTREGDSFRLVRRGADDLDQRLLTDPAAALPDDGAVYMDLSAALDPPPGLSGNRPLHVLDADGTPHAVKAGESGDLLVEVGEQVKELGQFALEEIVGGADGDVSRDLYLLPAAGEACVPDEDALHDAEVPGSHETFDIDATRTYLSETEGLRILALTSSRDEALSLEEVARTRGHDLTAVALPSCTGEIATHVAAAAEADGERGIRAPLVHGATLHLDPVRSMDPLAVSGSFTDHPLGISHVVWTVQFDPPSPQRRSGDRGWGFALFRWTITLAIMWWLGSVVFGWLRRLKRAVTGSVDDA